MAHPRARLTFFGRQLLIKRVVIDGWSTATVAEQLGISRATAYKWVRRYRADGLPGLEDRSSRPHRSPRRSSDEVTAAIISARARRRYGPARLAPLTGYPRSTIYGVLRRAGLNRLRDTDRVTAAPVRYVACHPGALVHQDHKKLGRVPDGGGWRVLGHGVASQDRRVRAARRAMSSTDDNWTPAHPGAPRRTPAHLVWRPARAPERPRALVRP